MSSSTVTVYLGLGSNVGTRQDNLKKAMELISQRLRVGRVSSIYDTEPVGNVNQSRFLNQVCQVYTTLPPMALLTLVKGIELKLGRVPMAPNSPRIMDIDILFYGDQVVDDPKLVIPHPRLAERAFVLIPMAEIAPDLVHPVKHQTVAELVKGATGTQGVVKWKDS